MKLFTTRVKRFREHMEHERQNRYLWDESANGQWFVSGPRLSDIVEYHSIILRLVDRKNRQASKLMASYRGAGTVLFIGDIQSEIENKGYGSILMVNIIKIAEIIEASAITGDLAKTDSGHFDKLKHFYEKHGFTVDIDPTGATGSIHREMT